MPSLGDAHSEILKALQDRYGRPPDPTVEDGFEAVARAYLNQQLGNSRSQTVLGLMRDAGLLDPQTLASMDPSEFSTILESPSKPPRWVGLLRRLASWFAESGESEGLAEVPTENLRESLRNLNGLGPASVDAVLLYGLNRVSMPVDRALARVLIRHGWVDTSQDYDEIRQTLEGLAPEDPAALSALALGLDRVASEFCKPASPRCDRCPLRPWLPPSGPIEPM